MIIQKLERKIPEILLAVVFAYLLLAFLAPVMYRFSYEKAGLWINEFYENFCHQRVERSIFLFGEESPITFHTVGYLKDAGAIPQTNPDAPAFEWPEYFGHGYVGNSEVGWKVAICIRDIALYGSFLLAGLFVLIRKRVGKKEVNIPFWVLLGLMVPMMVDGVSLTIISWLRLDWVPSWYIYSNLKRIITGALFGSALALLVFPWLLSQEKLTKVKQNKRI
jgi:uncharacterized membrane protein